MQLIIELAQEHARSAEQHLTPYVLSVPLDRARIKEKEKVQAMRGRWDYLKLAPNDYLQRWPVSKRGNSSKADADDSTLIEPIQLALA